MHNENTGVNSDQDLPTSENTPSTHENGNQKINNKDQDKYWQDQGNPNPGSEIVGDPHTLNEQHEVRSDGVQDGYGERRRNAEPTDEQLQGGDFGDELDAGNMGENDTDNPFRDKEIL